MNAGASARLLTNAFAQVAQGAGKRRRRPNAALTPRSEA